MGGSAGLGVGCHIFHPCSGILTPDRLTRETYGMPSNIHRDHLQLPFLLFALHVGTQQGLRETRVLQNALRKEDLKSTDLARGFNVGKVCKFQLASETLWY